MKYDVELLATILGGVVPSFPFPANDFSICSSHDPSARIVSAIKIGLRSAANSTDVLTAAIGLCFAIFIFTDIYTVCRCHHNKGAWGSGEYCSPTIMFSTMF